MNWRWLPLYILFLDMVTWRTLARLSQSKQCYCFGHMKGGHDFLVLAPIDWIIFCWWTFLLLLGIGRGYILLVHFITREMTSQFDFVFCCYVLSTNHNILDNNTFFITRENSIFGVISSFLSFLLLLGQGEHTQIQQPKANNLEIKNLRWWHAMEIGDCSLPLPRDKIKFLILILWLNM